MYTMPRCRNSIINKRHLGNEKQTKRGAGKFALNDQWQNPFQHLIVKTGKSIEEYAVVQASFKSECRASDEFRRANQIINNVVQSKQQRCIEIVNSLQEKWIGY